MVVDYLRCCDVVKSLSNYFNGRSDVASIEFPSNVLYKSNEYYLYMFYSCLLDYGMRSKIYHSNLVNTYMKYHEIFEPSYVLKMNKDELRDIVVSNIHPRYPNVALKKWIELSSFLVQYDDIVSVLSGMNSFDKVNTFIRSIKGYGQKTGGLLIRIICDSGICDFSDVHCIPIDRHDIEISYLTGIISSMKLSSKEIDLLSDTYVKVGRELGVRPSDVDKYLWAIGSSFCIKKDCDSCPLREYCSKR